MAILVLGATGATGQLLTKQLLDRNQTVKVVVRSQDRLPETFRNHPNLSVTEGNVLDMSDGDLSELVKDCSAVASCLGHRLSFKGMFGPPYRLVTETARKVCEAIKANEGGETPVRYVLMNTTGNRNRDLDEPISTGQKFVVGLLRLLLPPHADNEDAADYLRTEFGQNDSHIEWVAVRPDGLVDHEDVTEYDLHPSPIRSAIFDSGQTSRINVGHFMAELITNDELWAEWKGQMPVIYNRS